MQILGTVLNIIFIITCVLLVILILMQSGRSSGMGLFGGSGSQSAFGANSADVLTKTTAVLVALFMLTGFGMAYIQKNSTNFQKIQEKISEDSDAQMGTDKPAEQTEPAAQENKTAPEAEQAK